MVAVSRQELDSIVGDFAEQPLEASSGSGFLHLYPLVGGGEVTNAFCGNFSGWKICDNVAMHESIGKLTGKDYAGKAFTRKVHFSCGKPSCPICCRGSWAGRQARKVEARLVRASEQLGLDIEHISVSINPKSYGIGDEKVLRAMAMKALEELGVVGGSLLFHGSRHRRFERIQGSGFRQFGTDWSPHYHELGFIRGGYTCRDCERKSNCLEGCGGFDDRRWQYYLKTGIYVKVMYYKRKSVFGTAWYQAHHASIKRGATRSHVVTWHGVCGYRNMRAVKLVKKTDECPICHSPLKDGVYIGKKNFVLNRYSPDYVRDSMEDLAEGGVVVWYVCLNGLMVVVP